VLNGLNYLGKVTIERIQGFGDFCGFCSRAISLIPSSMKRRSSLRALGQQMYEVGTLSMPVVMITGLFVGMVLAVQAFPQFKAVGMLSSMGPLVNLSVLRELGPVLASIMLAGRVGGGLTAELGTMRVTEQIAALEAMGASPMRVLVVPRFLACMILTPLLVVYADIMGILGGYLISVTVFGLSSAEFWRSSLDVLYSYDVFYGLAKSLAFGVALGLICCYKGFRCSAGAAGVGKACTQAFVASCMAILGLNLFMGIFLNTIEELFLGLRVVV
jgi:phospholipid/cholesterol/gamma-HCH transport system permease protein